MALVHADWVKETSTTTGTGTYDLAGAATGFRTFVAGIGTTNTCYYSATDGTDWEVGIGTVTDAATDTLARTTILSSSNSNAAVSWGAGTKTLVCTIPASKYRAIGEAVLAADIPTATQAEQETGSSTTVFVSPGRQHFHPSAAKFWAKCAGAGTLTTSYNMTSVTDTGTGDLDGTIATDFSSADWCLIATIQSTDVDLTNSYTNKVINVNAQAAGTFGIQCGEWIINATTLSGMDVNLQDPTSYFIVGFGDFA